MKEIEILPLVSRRDLNIWRAHTNKLEREYLLSKEMEMPIKMSKNVNIEVELKTIKEKIYAHNVINLYYITHEEVNKVTLTEGLILIAHDLGLKHKLYNYYQYHVRNITAYKYKYPDLISLIFPGKHFITSLVEEELTMFNTFINMYLKEYAKYVPYDPTNGLIIYSCIVYNNKESVWLTDTLIKEIQSEVRFFRLTYPHNLNKQERYTLRQKSILYYENLYLTNKNYLNYIEKLKYFLACDIIFLIQQINDDLIKIIINYYFDIIKLIQQELLININITLETLNMTLEDFDILFNLDHTNGLIFFTYFASQVLRKEFYQELIHKSNFVMKKILAINNLENRIEGLNQEENLSLTKKQVIDNILYDSSKLPFNKNENLFLIKDNLKNNKRGVIKKVSELEINVVPKDNESLKIMYQINLSIDSLINPFLKDLFEKIQELLNLITWGDLNKLLTIRLLYQKVSGLLNNALIENDLDITFVKGIVISLTQFKKDIEFYRKGLVKGDHNNLEKKHTKFLLDINYDFINWNHSLIEKIYEKEILNKRSNLLNSIKDIRYLKAFSKMPKINISLISILFNNTHKKDFINLTTEEESYFLIFFKSYVTSKNALETKILLDPTKGLITLCYYTCLQEDTSKNKYNTLKNILMKFKTYLYRMLQNPDIIFNNIDLYEYDIKTLIQSLAENTLPRKTIVDYDSLENLDNNFEDFDELLSVQNQQRVFIEKILDNPKLKLLKQQSKIFYLSENNRILNLELYINEFTIYQDIIMLSEEEFMFNLLEKKNVSAYFLHYILYLGQKIFHRNQNTPLSHFMNYLYIYNNYNHYTVNLISLLFANINLVSIEDLSYKQKKLLLIFLNEILLPDKNIYEALSLKLLLDKSGGMVLIQYYIYHKSPKQNLNSKELYDIKKTIIKFQFDNDIEIIHDFIDKTPKLIKYANNLAENKFNDHIFINKQEKKSLFINLIL